MVPRRNGDGRLVLVSGESRIGKTALLEAFEQRSTGARWLWGACDGLLTPRPLGPLFDIGPQVGGELAELCRQGAPRDRLFGAFRGELASPAAFTVVAMEDLHWADEATIDLLSFVGRRLARTPALVLATYRDDELGEDHPLRMVLGDLATQGATRRMRLPPLSEEAVRALVGQRDVDAAELHRVTGGNPFYVSEVLEAGWPSVPPTVRDAIGGPAGTVQYADKAGGRVRGCSRGTAGPVSSAVGRGGSEHIDRGVPGDRDARSRRGRAAISA
jgi:AAA ATPase domain